MAICNHQADSPLYVCPGVWSGDMQVEYDVHDAEFPLSDQASLNQRYTQAQSLAHIRNNNVLTEL